MIEVEDHMIVAEQSMQTYLQAEYSRHFFVNPGTGRTNQILVCRQCNHSTQILCNMKHHLSCHSTEKPFRCNICSEGYG